MNKIVIILGLLLVSSQVFSKENSAKGIDSKQIYFGGGLGFNDANFGDNAIGFQMFAGLPIAIKTDNIKLAVEVGYMDSGNFEKNVPVFGTVSTKANGLWGTVVATVPLQDKMSLIGRFGLDVGDDDGIMIGAGVSFGMSEKMDLRAEYVIRDNIDSLQLNLVIRQ